MATDDDWGADDEARRAHSLYQESRDHTASWRDDAREAYDMVAGNQWLEEDEATLRDQQRPAVVFNRIARTVNAIVGTQVNNRQEVRFLPRQVGDVQVHEVLSAAAEYVRDACDAEDEESDAFEDMTICGMGWLETRLDYAHDPRGRIVQERIDPLEMYWDPGASKRNLVDARWVMRVKTMSKAQFEEEFPDVDIDAAAEPWDEAGEEVGTRLHVYPQDAYKNSRAFGGADRRDTVRVGQLQFAEREDVYVVGESMVELTADEFRRLKTAIEERKLSYTKQQRDRWKQVFVAGGTTLGEVEDAPCPTGPSLHCMTYKRDRNRNTWFGVVRAMVDPQRWGNKLFSSVLDILNKGAKGGVMIEEGAVEDIGKFEENWSSPNAVHVLNPGAIAGQKVQPKPLVNLPPDLSSLMDFSLANIQEVSGVSPEMLGMSDNVQAGVLEYQRKQAGLSILAPLFDAMRHYRKVQGHTLLYFIRTYMNDGRLIRIVGGDGTEQYVPLALEQDTADYDIIIDESPTSPNQKDRAFTALLQMMPHLVQAQIPMPPELIDYAPIPSALASKWKEQITSGQQNQAAQLQQLQLERQALQQQMGKMAEENKKLKDKREETQAELAMKGEELKSRMAERQAEHELDKWKAEADYRLEVLKAEKKAELAQIEAQAKMDLQEFESLRDQEFRGRELDMKAEESRSKFREAVEKVTLSAPKRRVRIQRDKDGMIEGAEIEDILEDMATEGNA